MEINYLKSVQTQFEYYKTIAEKTIDQVKEEDLFWKFNDESNSIATIIKHLSGNMLSRWTDFLTTDGEKLWREREAEFETEVFSKSELMLIWQKGWDCLFDSLAKLTIEDLEKQILIRNQKQLALDAINRQLAHYPYHIGQIVFIGKMFMDDHWKSLSIPKGQTKSYNSEKFSNPQKEEFKVKLKNQ